MARRQRSTPVPTVHVLASHPARWRADPLTFIREVLVNPERGCPFVLYPAQERFIQEALTLTATGSLRYPELIFAAPKKSGKTTLAALMTLYTVMVLGGRFAEAYCVANDEEQAQGRVFHAIALIVEASPLLRHTATVSANRITFPGSGATITAIASDYAGAAGANPTISVFDELWGYTSERSRRLWDEMVPVPTRTVSTRLTVTYAGFEGESNLLEDLYRRGLRGIPIAPDLYRQDGLLMYWTHDLVAPWQTDAWREGMRAQSRPNAYLRMIENRFVTGSESFVPLEQWDACVDPTAHPLITDRSLPVWVGVDASVKRDSTAIVACTWDRKSQRVRLVWHRIFQPTHAEPLDFEATVEDTLLELRKRFRLREVRYDPFQMVAVAQRLQKAGLPMVESPQSLPNLTEASAALYEQLRSRALVLYPDADMRLALQRTVAVETGRGWRIAKDKVNHKIDVIVALAMAALGAVKGGQTAGPVSARDFITLNEDLVNPDRWGGFGLTPRRRWD
jgi:phage terminase large subunit-like protein